jgi:hypothetical protein
MPPRHGDMNTLPMNYVLRFVLRALSVVTVIAIGVVVHPPALAQSSSTGTITGRVFNPATGEYVRDAEVRLQGTDRLVTTASDGSFQLTNVPAGLATVSVSYTGYQTATETINVSPGQSAAREINLVSAAPGADSTIRLGAFVVSNDREGNAKAIMAQKRSMNITTTVASDIFGDVSEGNVGEFLKFLPGVDVEYQIRTPRHAVRGLAGCRRNTSASRWTVRKWRAPTRWGPTTVSSTRRTPAARWASSSFR